MIITTGGQEALAAAFFAFLEPGDEVVLFEPCYPFMLGAVLQGIYGRAACQTGS